MPSNLNQPGESNPYKDFKDYTGAKPEPFKDQGKKKKKNGGPQYKQIPLDLATVESFRKKHQKKVNLT